MTKSAVFWIDWNKSDDSVMAKIETIVSNEETIGNRRYERKYSVSANIFIGDKEETVEEQIERNVNEIEKSLKFEKDFNMRFAYRLHKEYLKDIDMRELADTGYSMLDEKKEKEPDYLSQLKFFTDKLKQLELSEAWDDEDDYCPDCGEDEEDCDCWEED